MKIFNPGREINDENIVEICDDLVKKYGCDKLKEIK